MARSRACYGWLKTKKRPGSSISGVAGALLCLCAVEGREAVTLGHTGANAAFYLLGGARGAACLSVGTNGLKRATLVR